MRVLRLIYRNMLVLVFVLTSWFAVPTSVFISDVETIINGHEVTFKRITPFGEMHARWREEITMIGSGFECRTSWKQDRFQQQAGNAVEYTASPELWPCLDLKQPFTYWSIRRAYLFGVIPLRTSDSLDVVIP